MTTEEVRTLFLESLKKAETLPSSLGLYAKMMEASVGELAKYESDQQFDDSDLAKQSVKFFAEKAAIFPARMIAKSIAVKSKPFSLVAMPKDGVAYWKTEPALEIDGQVLRVSIDMSIRVDAFQGELATVENFTEVAARLLQRSPDCYWLCSTYLSEPMRKFGNEHGVNRWTCSRYFDPGVV